jgi:hypothetical protein
MKSRFQKKNYRKSRRQSVRRKIQRGLGIGAIGMPNCRQYAPPCPQSCKRLGLRCVSPKEYAAEISRKKVNVVVK